MPPDQHKQTRRVITWAVVTASVVVLAASGLTFVPVPWLSGVLANAAVTGLLLVPAAFVTERLTRRIDVVEQSVDRSNLIATAAQEGADSASADVSVLQDAVHQTRAQDLADRLQAAQQSELDAKLDLFDTWLHNLDRASITTALRYAIENELVSTGGYRVPLAETSLHLRIRFAPTDDTLTLAVEDANGTVRGIVIWEPDQSEDEAVAEAEKIIRGTGEHPAATWQLTVLALEAMAKSLRFAEAERAMPIMDGGNFHHLVQFTGQNGDEDHAWYITERIMFPRDHMYYTIALTRLGETDWDLHLNRKGWTGSSIALEIAQALFPQNQKDGAGGHYPDAVTLG